MRKMVNAVALLLVGAVACSENDPESAAGVTPDAPLSVYAVNYPLQYFAERIGGPHVDAVLPTPLDVDPAFWKPDPEVVATYQAADVILENGAGYAAWTRHATLPRGRRVDTSTAFRDRLIAGSDRLTHGHGPEGAHTHSPTAFTTWLDPTLAALQARAVAEALIAPRPGLESEFRSGLATLEADLEALDARWRAALAPLAGQPVLFSHPVYQYLARRYDLTGHSLHWEPGEMPARSEWASLAARLEERPVSVILFEGDPHPDAERRLTEMGIRTIVFAPGGNRPETGDWLDLMRANVARLEAVTGAGGRD